MEQKAVHLASIVDDKVLGHHPTLQHPPLHQPPPLQHPPPHQPPPHQQLSPLTPISVASQARLKPNLPLRYLFATRERYLKTGVPLYEASIKCDWKAAKAIIDKKRELVRYSVTENGETALHVAASAKVPKKVEEFVKNLVDMMTPEDLALENESFNTALYLAAVAGNLEAVKIMVGKNRGLLVIPGAGGKMMPLYAAALFGNYEMVKYLYINSKELKDDGWTTQNRGWLLEKCVEGDMFDVAIEIIKKYPELGSGGNPPENSDCGSNVLGILARKPEAFPDPKSSMIGETIKWGKNLYSSVFPADKPSPNNDEQHGNESVHKALALKPYQPSQGKDQQHRNEVEQKDLAKNPDPFPETKSTIIRKTITSVFAVVGIKVRPPKKQSNALPLLKLIWEDLAKKPKNEIDKILRGKPDANKQDKSASRRVVQAMQLQKLINKHLEEMDVKTQNIIRIKTDLASEKAVQALKLRNLVSESLVSLHVETQLIIGGPTDPIKEDNKPASDKADQSLELQKLISEHILKMHEEIQKILETHSKDEDQVPQLQKVIFTCIDKMHKDSQRVIRKPSKGTYSNRVLFIAAEMGNTNFLIELIRQYPDLIWKVNDNNQTIFHIAIQHRHEGIYNLLYEIGAMKDLITPLRDPKDNNMLHLVGTIAKQKRLEDVSGVALQMQQELLWFNEVKSMIPSSYRERKNGDDLTPHELFTLEHKELVKLGEEWMKGTASQCMVVAALIATIVFAAAFTVPGGNGDDGIPIFHSKATFMVFVVSDAISLFSSSASILMFLSILTSRYAERDFLESLPNKLILGLATLFLSITTMTVAFGVSFFVLYHKGLLWIPILICVFAVFPVLLYVMLQYGLFVDVIRSTYRSRYLFKPKKHVLYYQNPTV